jgi:hypothetical protein
MKRLIILILAAIFFLPSIVLSQEVKEEKKEKRIKDHGLIFLLGPALNYHFGPKGSSKEYSNSKISWQVDGQLGVISTRHNTNRGNFLGVFGSFGTLSSETLQALADQAGRSIAIKEKQFNQFYSVEGGMIIFNFVRISGGLGRQFYEETTSTVSSVNYFSLTGGLNFNFGAVNLGLNANLLTGNDLAQNQLRFSTGILIKF